MGVHLPEPGAGSLENCLGAAAKEIGDRAGWRVSDEVALATFAFSKLAMYEDLDQMRREGVGHPLVRRLAGRVETGDASKNGGSGVSAIPLPDLKGGKLDDLLDPNGQFNVVDADYSQLLAIEAVRGGSNVVIHGPPGTGKSQTITNSIASLLADGKRVLFVSEKTAALDVVKRRLEDCGLGVFCLDLHSKRATKREVYRQLEACLEDPRRLDSVSSSPEDLARERARLKPFRSGPSSAAAPAEQDSL